MPRRGVMLVMEADVEHEVRYLLQELDRYAVLAEPVEPDRLLRMLVEGPADEWEKRTLAAVLQGSESLLYLSALMKLGAVPSASLLRIVRSLLAQGFFDTGLSVGTSAKKLLGSIEHTHQVLVEEGRAVPDPAGPRRGRRPAHPSGARTAAERKAASRHRQSVTGHASRSFVLRRSALAALAQLKSRAPAGTTLDELVSAALEQAARSYLDLPVAECAAGDQGGSDEPQATGSAVPLGASMPGGAEPVGRAPPALATWLISDTAAAPCSSGA